MPELLSATEYRLLVDHSPVLLWRAKLDATCDYFNDTWLAFTGRTMEQEVGNGWAEGVHPDDFQRCLAYYLDHFNRREAFEMEYRLRRHDGVYRWILDRGAPYTNDAGEFAGFIGSCVDVDDRRRATDADHQQLALAREFESWILAIVSHDIRNPLGAISSSTKVLATRSADPHVQSIAQRIDRSAARITHIVADLLDMSRERHGGGIPVVLAETDLHALCRDVVDEIATVATDRKIELSCEGNAIGTWDSHRLTQAVSNLIGNAVKHGDPNKPIEVRVHGDHDKAIVEIHNDGAIPPAVMPTLFQAFAARSDRNRHNDGLGLGLFIARAIVRAHAGDVEVDSSHERGTTFRLVLPRA